MFPSFPYFSSFAELEDALPSKPKSIKAELSYRKGCVKIILACGSPINLNHATLHKAVVLMHRFFTRCSSDDWQKMHKWAVAAACVFLAAKIDSAYTKLEYVAHHAYRKMKDLYSGGRYDAEYFNTDGTPGNPKFLSYLSHLVCQAESCVLFAINFDFNIEVASSMVVYQLNELGLTAEREAQEAAVGAVRRDVMRLAKTSLEVCKPESASQSLSFLLYNARDIALACIWKACRLHRVPLDWHNMNRRCYVPDLTEEQLAEIETVLPRLQGQQPSRAATPALSSGAGTGLPQGQQQLQQRGGEAAAGVETAAVSGYGSATAHNTPPNRLKQEQQEAAAAADGSVHNRFKHEPGAAGASLGDGSQAEAATVGPRVSRSPISPDSQTGPAAFAAASGVGVNSSGAQQQQQQQRSRKRLRQDGAVGNGMLIAPDQNGLVAVA